jgi:LPS-assembly protein
LGTFLCLDASYAQERTEDFGLSLSMPRQLEIEAGQLEAVEEGKLILLTGGVHLSSSNLDIRAEWAQVDTANQKFIFSGSVRVIEGPSVLLVDRLELDGESSASMQQAVIVVKKHVDFKSLKRLTTAYELLKSGTNELTLIGREVEKKDDNYQLSSARFTACDCKHDKSPSWEIRACQADVVPDQRAWLTWPVLYLKGLPVFGLPLAYLPLSNRRTGLLFPQINYSGRDGFVLSESLFVTMGRSMDVTLTLDWFEERGFREQFEFRARPSRTSGVNLKLTYLDDQKFAQDQNLVDLRNRFSAEMDVWAKAGEQIFLRGSFLVFSDSDINRDFMSELSGRAADLAPSRLAIFKNSMNTISSVDLAYIQDLRFGRVDLWGDQADDTIQRLGAFSFFLAPISCLAGWPCRFSFLLEGANWSSLSATWYDWGLDGTPDMFEPRYIDAPADRGVDNGPGGEADGSLSTGELKRAFRFLIQPNVSFPFEIKKYANINFDLAHRQLVYLSHGPQAADPINRPITRGISRAAFLLSTELSRSYGSGAGSITHLISPWTQVAGVWQGLASSQPYQYFDIYDRMLGDAQQLLVGATTSLYRFNRRQGNMRFLNLAVYQGIDLTLGQVTQGACELDLRFSYLTFDAALSYDWTKNKVAEVDGQIRIRDRRKDSLAISYLYLPSVADSRGRPLPLAHRTQLEDGLLFGAEQAYFRALGESIHTMVGNAWWEIAWGLGMGLGASLDLYTQELSWYGGTVRYNSNCNCWGFSLSVRMLKGQTYPDVFFLLDLAYLGAAGIGSNTKF